MQAVSGLEFSISSTTRAPRGKEVHGVHYNFITVEAFKNTIAKNGFVEWEMVYEDKYYGTPTLEIERINKNKNIAVLDIDVEGASKVQENKNYDVCTIFIEVPSLEELKTRLINRATDSIEVIEERLNKAKQELAMKDKFKYIVVNDNLNTATEQVIEIVRNFINI